MHLLISGMEPSLQEKKTELFFMMTTVNAELVFNPVTAKLRIAPAA